MTSEKCKQFDICSAPLCPADKESLTGIWYPEEEICKNREFSKKLFIVMQKKISKKVKGENRDTYFNIKMLNRNMAIGINFAGLNPDDTTEKGVEQFRKKEELVVKKWLKAHKVIKQRILSEDEKKKINDRLHMKQNLEQKKEAKKVD